MFLREITAGSIKQAYLEARVAHGIDTRKVVSSSGHSLAAYVAEVKHYQWASALEVTIAADLLNLRVLISSPDGKCVTHMKPTHMVKLSRHHWTLHIIHRASKVRSPQQLHDMQQRGGMWTWEEPSHPAHVPQTSQPLSTSMFVHVPEDDDEEIPEWAATSHTTGNDPVGAQPISPRVPTIAEALPAAMSTAPSAPKADHPALTCSRTDPLPTEWVVSASKCVHATVDPVLKTDVVAVDMQVHCGAPMGVTLDRLAAILNIEGKDSCCL